MQARSAPSEAGGEVETFSVEEIGEAAGQGWYEHDLNSQISVDLDCELTPELVRRGYGREVVNRIQRERKERGFSVSDRIHVVFHADGVLAEAIAEHKDYIMGETLCLLMDLDASPQEVTAEIDEHAFSFQLGLAG